jgi:hypothetical protein
MTFTTANLFGQILFGAIGLAAFVYGRKQSLMKPTVLGIVIMAYPYFVPQTWLLYAIGAVLTASLFLLRD